MADPKYAGLPGIVYDQAGVYETIDLPESEQEFHDAYSEVIDSNPAIEVLHISANDSFRKFKGKSLNTNEVDFSDSIYKKHRRGYPSKPIEWSLNDRENETVVERYQRLQCEINELSNDVQKLKEPITHGDGSVSPPDLLNNIQNLKAALTNLQIEEVLGKNALSVGQDPDAVLEKKLKVLLDAFKKTDSGSEQGKQKGTKESGAGLCYEIYHAPEQAKLSAMATVTDLEKKLDKLENIVGSDSEKMSSLCSWTNQKGLLGAVRALNQRLVLLEPNHLDHIEGRLHSVHTRMNSIAEKKGGIEDAEKQKKIDELFELVKKNELLYPLVPEIVDRLSTLESLHNEGNQFNAALKQLDASQHQISTTLESNAAVLTALKKKMAEDLNDAQSRVQTLDERIKKISNKK